MLIDHLTEIETGTPVRLNRVKKQAAAPAPTKTPAEDWWKVLLPLSYSVQDRPSLEGWALDEE
jgi:hypothetical protein